MDGTLGDTTLKPSNDCEKRYQVVGWYTRADITVSVDYSATKKRSAFNRYRRNKEHADESEMIIWDHETGKELRPYHD